MTEPTLFIPAQPDERIEAPADAMDLIRISRTAQNHVRVAFTAATENSFELVPNPAQDNDRLLADILRVIVPLIRQDVALAELGDGNLNAAISQADVFLIHTFVSRYHRIITAVDTDTLGLP